MSVNEATETVKIAAGDKVLLLLLTEYDWDEGVHVLLVPCEPKLADELGRRLEAVRSLRDGPDRNDVAEIVYWDTREVYRVYYTQLQPDEVEEAEGTLERLCDERLVVLPARPSWCRTMARCEACRMHVSDESVDWSVRLKGEDHPRFTTSIRFADALAGEA